MTSNELINQIKQGHITYNQLYNLDTELVQQCSIDYYLSNHNDNIDVEQKLHILPHDIEVYSNHTGEGLDSQKAKCPISSIAFFDPKNDIYYCYFLLLNKVNHIINEENREKIQLDIQNFLIEKEYLNPHEKVIIKLFTNELNLITSFWKKVQDIDPAILTGFNSDKYDIPYQYNRLHRLIGNEEETQKIMSRFGTVKIRKMGNKGLIYQIPGMPILDIRYLYMPRDDGGLNYGKKQPVYSLDYLSSVILKMKKISYTDDGTNLDKLYDTDPIKYITYNIADVVLPRKINNKLGMIELHNLLRRDMRTPLTLSLRGQSAFFDTFLTHELLRDNQVMKWGILDETTQSINEYEIKACKIPKQKKITKWTVKKVEQKIFRKISGRYPGAYVKNSRNLFVTNKDGIIIDDDAEALYPNMMRQHNISFDSLYGKIIEPYTYKFIDYIMGFIGTNKPLEDILYFQVLDMVHNYVEKLDPQGKNEYKQNMYFMICHLLNKLKEVNIRIEKLFKPDNQKEYIVLKLYLLPLIDLIADIHPNSDEFNSFVHDHALNGHYDRTEYLYIVNNIMEPTINVKKVNAKDIENFLKQNGICLNISGALFYTHEKHEGIIYKFLSDRLSLRKQYKSKMYNYEKGTDEFTFYNNRQNSMKINANSSYGLTGMAGFRFSNRLLALSTTVSGRLALKIAQMCGQLYIQELEKNE